MEQSSQRKITFRIWTLQFFIATTQTTKYTLMISKIWVLKLSCWFYGVLCPWSSIICICGYKGAANSWQHFNLTRRKHIASLSHCISLVLTLRYIHYFECVVFFWIWRVLSFDAAATWCQGCEFSNMFKVRDELSFRAHHMMWLFLQKKSFKIFHKVHWKPIPPSTRCTETNICQRLLQLAGFLN